MWKRISSAGFLCILLLALSAGVLNAIKINGDGAEYLLVTHALFRHASVAIRPEDVKEYEAMRGWELGHMNFPSETYAKVLNMFETAQRSPWNGFASTEPNKFYSIHFWMYPLLAVPFYAVLHALGLNPLWALGLLNLSCAGAVLLYLRRALPYYSSTAFVLFLAMGGTFYLPWTGPEFMTASCALVASIALLRGELGLSVFICGLGATQNPTLIFMMPFAVGFRILLRKWPQLAWPGSTPGPIGKSDILLAVAGVALGLLPYVFFQLIFGMPSLVGHYFTAPELMSANRFFSLLFDLDQGMLVGLPGLFAALAASALLVDRADRVRWLTIAAPLSLLVGAMIVPALSAINWNSGCVVMLRYAYWSAMPLFALVLLGLHYLSKTRAVCIMLAALALQGTLMVEFGLFGETSSPVAHTAQTRWVLNHFPSLYNPDAEIFYERSIGSEDPMPIDLTYLYLQNGKAVKLLRHASNIGVSPNLCPPNQRLEGQDLRSVDGGWQYAHPPFQCQPVESSRWIGSWAFDSTHPDNQALLSQGWSKQEAQGVWSDGPQSTLTLPVTTNASTLRVHMRGFYYRKQTSILTVNGNNMGTVDLSDNTLTVPVTKQMGDKLVIDIAHPFADSPHAHGESKDIRKLGFYLQSISIEATSK